MPSDWVRYPALAGCAAHAQAALKYRRFTSILIAQYHPTTDMMHRLQGRNATASLLGLVAAFLMAAIPAAISARSALAKCDGPDAKICPFDGEGVKVPTKTPYPTETAISIRPLVVPATGASVSSTPTLTPDQQLPAFGAETATAIAAIVTSTPAASATDAVAPFAASGQSTAGANSNRNGGGQQTSASVVIIPAIGLIIIGGLVLVWLSRRARDRRGPPTRGN